MSLDWQVDKIKDFKTLCYKGRKPNIKLNPVTNGLIWATMKVGLGEITEGNIDEWMARLDITDKLFGTTLVKHTRRGPKPSPFTREDLVAHIGLRTNVSNEKRASWLKRQVECYMREADYRIRQEKKVPGKAAV